MSRCVQYGCKKKENLGLFRRDGKIYSTGEVAVNDHDFASFSTWKAIPHWIYDMLENKWYITLWTSKDTCEFSIDCLRQWRRSYGYKMYQDAPYLLFFADCGWSNAVRSYLFKFFLEQLSNEIGKEIRISHYPPYSSKRNPIEHRLFCHVSRACEWTPFTNIELVKMLMERTCTKTWLTVVVSIINIKYEKKTYDKSYKKQMKILRDEYLPQRNYRAIPNI